MWLGNYKAQCEFAFGCYFASSTAVKYCDEHVIMSVRIPCGSGAASKWVSV